MGKINDTLLNHWFTLEENYNIWFISLYGSQNYNLDDELSDIDTKALILPNFNQLYYKRGEINKVIITENNEHIEVKDAKSMVKNFWKQNINFLEILFTKYSIVNDDYLDEWNELVRLKEEIARYNIEVGIKAIYGMARSKYENLATPHPSVLHLIEKNGYDGKQLSNIMRLNNFLYNYIAGVPFEECLTKHNLWTKIALIEAKRNCYSFEMANNIAKSCIKMMETQYYEFKNKHKNIEINEKVVKEVDEIIYSLYKKSLYKEFEKEMSL